MVLVRPVEHSVLIGAFLSLGALIDEVLTDQLLELLQEKHALGVGDGEGAEGEEAGVLSVSLPLRLGGNGGHKVTLLAGKIQILEHFTLANGDLLDTITLFLDEFERK